MFPEPTRRRLKLKKRNRMGIPDNQRFVRIDPTRVMIAR